MLAVLIIITIGSIFFLYVVAGKRGASRKFRVMMGLLFGPLAIPFIFFSRRKKRSSGI